MSTMNHTTSETSVTFSLAELAKLEGDRVREEDAKRARARALSAREQRDAEAQRRAAEEADLAAQVEARARRAREDAEEKARLEARNQAALQVARIEAEARARIDADNAARAHELAVLRVKTEGGHRRALIGLAAALALAISGGAIAAYEGSQRAAALEQDAGQLREGSAALAHERDQARATALATLDQRYLTLRARPLARDAAAAQAAADDARHAVDPIALDPSRLRAFGDALDALAARIEGLEKLAALDQRRDDLDAWAAQQRKGEATAAARSAADRAKAKPDEGALRGYEGALDQARDALAQSSTRGGPKPPPRADGPRCTDPHDPMCGLDGRPL